MGSGMSDAKLTQYCKIEENKLVLASKVDTKGVPFADCFHVQLRLVATNEGDNRLLIKVGMFVVFVKSTVVAGKIRAGATRTTTQQQLDLVEKIQTALGGTSVESALPEEDLEEEEVSAETSRFKDLFRPCMPKMKGITPETTMLEDDEEMAKKVKLIEKKLKALDVFVDQRKDDAETEDLNFVLAQLVVANQALENIVTWNPERVSVVQA
jgi:hypothetical protein